MKKTVFALILAVSAVVTAAYAQDIYTDKRAIVSCYDDLGKLVYSDMYTPSDGKVSLNIPDEFSDIKTRVYLEEKEQFFNLDELEAPEPSASPLPSQTPEPTPTAAPKKTPYPSIYPREADAKNAFAVCESVAQVLNDDGEEAYSIIAMYQGKETEFIVNSDIKINSAPSQNLNLSGQKANVLKKGDVFRVTYNLAKTKINSLEFIYRPEIKDIVFNDEDYGNNFEKLFSYNGWVGGLKNQTVMKYGENNKDKYQYAFGVVMERKGNNLTLMNKGGKIDDALDIDLQDNTIVYLCDVENDYKTKVSTIAGITETYNPFFKDGEDIAHWYRTSDTTYALVRTIDGTATDIVVYKIKK